MPRRHIWVLLICLSLCWASMVLAQTPLDTKFLQVDASARNWAIAIITVIGIIIGLLLCAALHLGPQVMLYIVFGLIAIGVIGAAINGSLVQWATGG